MLVLIDAINQVQRLGQILEDDSSTLAWVEDLLKDSAGTVQNEQDEPIPFYRTYYVTAQFYWLKPSNNLIKGEGAEFDQNKSTTLRYILQQQKIDNKMSVTVPEAYTCSGFINEVKSGVASDIKMPGFLAF